VANVINVAGGFDAWRKTDLPVSVEAAAKV
jgi:rhodanese-related sulfurtransferase